MLGKKLHITPGDGEFINPSVCEFSSKAFLKFKISLLTETSSFILSSLVQHGLLYVGVPPDRISFFLKDGKSSKSFGAFLSLSPEKPSTLSFI